MEEGCRKHERSKKNERREEEKKGKCKKKGMGLIASPAFLGLIFTLWRDAPVDVMNYTIP